MLTELNTIYIKKYFPFNNEVRKDMKLINKVCWFIVIFYAK